MIKPQRPQEFIGKTRLIAAAVFNKVPHLHTLEDPLDRCYLFTGPPGTGKTTLAESMAAAVSGNPIANVWRRSAPCVEQVNGQSCTVDTVRKWQEDGWYHPLYGKAWVKLVDEIDAASTAACNELRSYLDKLPPRTVFIATTNKPVHELQEQLQSRFKIHYFNHAPTDAVTAWLTTEMHVPAQVAAQISAKTKGNVRAARADALGYVETMQSMAVA